MRRIQWPRRLRLRFISCILGGAPLMRGVESARLAACAGGRRGGGQGVAADVQSVHSRVRQGRKTRLVVRAKCARYSLSNGGRPPSLTRYPLRRPARLARLGTAAGLLPLPASEAWGEGWGEVPKDAGRRGQERLPDRVASSPRPSRGGEGEGASSVGGSVMPRPAQPSPLGFCCSHRRL